MIKRTAKKKKKPEASREKTVNITTDEEETASIPVQDAGMKTEYEGTTMKGKQETGSISVNATINIDETAVESFVDKDILVLLCRKR